VILDASVAGHNVRVEVKGGNGRFTVSLDDGRLREVDCVDTGGGFLSLLVEGGSHEVGLTATATGYTVVLRDEVLSVDLTAGARGAGAPARRAVSGPLRLTAPMPGKIVRVLVAVAEEVAAGQGLVVMEAMKMENELKAPRAGRVKDLGVREGQAVETGTLLATLE
jgi:biotin carboxyl carrier protein